MSKLDYGERLKLVHREDLTETILQYFDVEYRDMRLSFGRSLMDRYKKNGLISFVVNLDNKQYTPTLSMRAKFTEHQDIPDRLVISNS